MPVGLAFKSFFRLLFGNKLPPEAAAWLPEEALPKPKLVDKVPERRDDKPAAADKPAVADKPAAPRKDNAALHREGALAMLALLQREGRLIDFLREPLDGFADADIGAAARDVHRGCKKVIDQTLSLEPMIPGAEDDKVTVPRGFDPSEIRLIGEAKGEPPFAGTLRHHGWRAVDTRLPALADGLDRAVLAPAEVEVGPTGGSGGGGAG
jgi:hypothetical protein